MSDLGNWLKQKMDERGLTYNATAVYAGVGQATISDILALARGDMDGDIYRQADDRLRSQLDAEQGRAVDLSRQIESLPDLAERRRELQTLYRRFTDWVRKDEPATIAKLLQSADLVVWIEDHQIVGVEWS